jgi:ElaB/YqjD/DUF883 family membrane-anchored ribosome-binding protein
MATLGNGESIGSDIDTLKDDLSSLRTSVSDLMKHLLDEGKGKAGEVSSKLRASAKEGVDVAEGKIRDRPLLFVLIALVVGIVFGRLVLK